MSSRRLLQLAVAGAAFAAGLGHADPAAASVRYDPGTKTGFVDGGDVRKAFGWTRATLAARAGGLVFDHDFWTDDTYSVACGRAAFPVVHHRDFGRFGLTDTVTRDGRRGSPTGYGYRGRLVGFRITGASYGISGTSVPPMIGQPCPEEKGQAPGSTIDKVGLVSSSTGWALTVSSGEASRKLRVHRERIGATAPGRA